MPGYDPGLRRRGVRKGRERGCWVYIPAEELTAARIVSNGHPPFYRVWPGRGTVMIRFYQEK
jgi:hypothetical protein